jgi:ribosome-associated protein
MSVTENSKDDDYSETAMLVARIADDFRGKDILLLDMRPITPIVDFFVIATASSQRQMKAMG